MPNLKNPTSNSVNSQPLNFNPANPQIKETGFTQTRVGNIDTPAPWVGGKRTLAKTISEYIRKTPHHTYAEPFVGMGGVFFKKRVIAPREVINDYNSEIVNLFRILRKHKQAFIDNLKYLIASREEFETLNSISPQYLTDIEKAVRFLYLQRLGFGGKVDKRGFGVNRGSKSRGYTSLFADSSRFNALRLTERLDKIATRLYRVVLENLDFEDFIKKYDTDWILFYLDPPYYNCEDYYGKDMFKKEDFIRLRDTLANIKGKFIMSINDTQEIRKLFEQFYVKEVNATYCLAGGNNAKKAPELLIFNYDHDLINP